MFSLSGFDMLRKLGLSLLLAVACCSCSKGDYEVAPPPGVEGASLVGNTGCFECHTNLVQGYLSSSHAALYNKDPKWQGMSGCEACHGPGSEHVAVGGGRGGHIINPRHDPEACLRCHQSVRTKFRLPHRHPVLEGDMNCVQCHDPHGPDIMRPSGGVGFARLNESCAQCHRSQARQFVFQHEAMREGCVVCHDPHGSFNDKMLVQNDANLCLKCHAQVQGLGVLAGELFIGKVNHTFQLAQGTCWSAGCHQGVHGSNIHPRFRVR